MARRRQLSIPTRIFLGFALVLAAFAVVAVTSMVQHERTTRTLQLLHEGYLPLALTVGEARATQAVFATLLDRVMQERDTTATRSWLDTARRVRPATLQRALEGVERAEQLDPPAGDRKTLRRVRRELERIRQAYAETDAQYNQLFHALESGDGGRAEMLLDELRSRERAIQNRFREAWRQLQQRITKTSSRAAQQEQRAAVILGILTLLAIAVGVGVTWWSQRVLQPLPALHERVQAVATGDLSSRRLEPRRDDELGRLTREFERMVEALAARDARLREAAEAQQRLQRMQQQIVASLRDAVVVVDDESVVRTVNPAAYDVLGLSEDMVGTSLWDTDLATRLPELRDAIRRVAEGGEERAVLEAAELEATERYVDVLVTPFESGDERAAVLVVAKDITEELETKRRLIHTERLAAIGKMAAHVTHEVRNPLSSIGLNVEMLEEELGDRAGEEARGLVRAIQGEMERLRAITDEYLRVARLPEPRLEPEDVGALGRSTVEFVQPEMEAAGIEVELDIEPGLPYVPIDEQQLRQALLNLLRNAREAMPEGGRAGLQVRNADGGIRIRIWDEGPGIDPAARERMFDLFYTTKEHGTGLGLPLTQQIVVAHAGEIRCEDAPGGGTVFDVWLPAARTPEGAGVSSPSAEAGIRARKETRSEG